MRLECVETLVEAAVTVLEAVLGEGVGRGEVALVAAESPSGGVLIRVGVAGAVEGRVCLVMAEETAVRLGNRMAGSGEEALTPLLLDCLGELGNLIAGRAASALNDLGLEVVIRPPEVVSAGGGHPPGEEEACRLPIYCTHGPLSVEAVLRET